MSYKAQQWALEQDDISGLEKWVLFMLAYRDNHEEPHGCWPSIGRLAKDCNLGRSTIKRAIKSLSEAGKIVIETRQDRHGDSDSNWFTFPLVWAAADSHGVGPQRAHLGPHGTRGRSTADLGVGPQRTPNHKELTNIEPKDIVSSKKVTEILSSLDAPEDHFEEFWKIYPRKIAKVIAKKAWVKSRANDSWEAVLSGVARWVASGQWYDQQFIPHASTFLNGRRWEDEVPNGTGGQARSKAQQRQDNSIAAIKRVLGHGERVLTSPVRSLPSGDQ